MKIQVVRCDGRVETLNLIGTVCVKEAAEVDGKVVGQGRLLIAMAHRQLFQPAPREEPPKHPWWMLEDKTTKDKEGA
jgi:hypothetical protein